MQASAKQTLAALMIGALSLSCAAKSSSGTATRGSGTGTLVPAASGGAPATLITNRAGQSGAGAQAMAGQGKASAAGTNSASSASAGGAATSPAPSTAASDKCNSDALDLAGCACDKAGATRACYTADPVTRNVGACKDGFQTCEAGGVGIEFGGQWGACKDFVVPTVCKAQLDARCVGKVGCADEQCADALGCPKDAGVPDAGNPKCHQVNGFGFGTGFFPDGGMWCER